MMISFNETMDRHSLDIVKPDLFGGKREEVIGMLQFYPDKPAYIISFSDRPFTLTIDELETVIRKYNHIVAMRSQGVTREA